MRKGDEKRITIFSGGWFRSSTRRTEVFYPSKQFLINKYFNRRGIFNREFYLRIMIVVSLVQ